MSKQHIKDISIEFKGDEATKYGLFPLFAWYLMDIVSLHSYFKDVTVKRKRNNEQPVKRRKSKYNTSQMCVGIITAILLGVKRMKKINNILHTEKKIAELVGLPGFFEQSTGHIFLNEFQSWHVKQLDKINTKLIHDFGESKIQDVILLDIDMTTHSFESRKRERCVVGYNKKNRGKPCYQWSVGFVRGEVVSQKLDGGNTHCSQHFKEIVESVRKKLEKSISIIRVDGGYCSGEVLDYAVKEGHQIVMPVRYDWVMSQGIELEEDKWIRHDDEGTKLYDIGISPVIGTSKNQFRVVLVESKQNPFKGHKKNKKRTCRYAIVENLVVRLSAEALFEFYHQRQTIENYFKESKGGFNSGKIPSQKFRANEAYLQLVVMSQNLYLWFKKNVCQNNGRVILWKPLETK